MNENEIKNEKAVNDELRRWKRLKTLNILSIAVIPVIIAAGFIAAVIVELLYPMAIAAVLLAGILVFRIWLKKQKVCAKCCPVCESTNISVIPSSDVLIPMLAHTPRISTMDNFGNKYTCNRCGNKW